MSTHDTQSFDQSVHFSDNPFVLTRGFTLMNYGIAVLVPLFVCVVFSLPLVWSIFAIPILLGLLAFNGQAARSRVREWRIHPYQRAVPVINNWLQGRSKVSAIDRARHILTKDEDRIILISRRSNWYAVFKVIPQLTAWCLVVLPCLYIGSYTFQGTRQVQRYVTGPRGNRHLKVTDITYDFTIHFWWIAVGVSVLLLLMLAASWIDWYYTFFVVTSHYVYTDLRLPPVFLPFMDTNELAYTLSRVGMVDNVHSVLGQMLKYGGIEIVLDLSKGAGPYVIHMMPMPRELVRIVRAAVTAASKVEGGATID